MANTDAGRVIDIPARLKRSISFAPNGAGIVSTDAGSFHLPAPHWKVRIHAAGGAIHVASSTEPVLKFNSDGRVEAIDLTEIPDSENYSDRIGYLDHSTVSLVSWRWSNPAREWMDKRLA